MSYGHATLAERGDSLRLIFDFRAAVLDRRIVRKEDEKKSSLSNISIGVKIHRGDETNAT